MTDTMHIEGVAGCFCREDNKELRIGEYYRLPNGRVYFYHSDEPTTLFMPVMEFDIPKIMEIIKLVERV